MIGVAGYNGTYLITSVPSTTTFTYFDPTTGLAGSGGGLGAIVSSVTPTLGSGTLALQSDETYSGSTTVNQGTVTLNNGGQLLNTAGTNAAAKPLTFGGTVTGGTFTLTFNGQTTGAIQWSATAATLQANILTSLEALPNIGLTNFNIPNASRCPPRPTLL